MDVNVEEADLADEVQSESLAEILDSYARGPGGQNAPLSLEARARLADGLREHSNATVLLAYADRRAVGAAVCVWSFSTFAGRPSVNIHDLAVLPEFRDRGIGRALLAAVEARALARDCCKITLEVHDSNEGAKRLYASVGFGPWDSRTLFLTRKLPSD
jgi:ribosomal protein S18 acetylase RimI-like enzyme